MEISAENPAGVLISRAHSPDRAGIIFREKVQLRPLLLRPTSPDPSLNARSKRQYARLQKVKAARKSTKPKPLSAKQKRALCIYDIPASQQKYSIYEPLHTMWCTYMREVLGERSYVDANIAGPLLISADYHGALLEVARSRCVSRVGLRGIVVKDTRFTFEMITENNEVKKVPKEHTLFKFELPRKEEDCKAMVFEIHGSQFESRAPDRANRKFKMHIDPDL
ncbi:related to ribonuclease P protein subunit p29 [Ramularia collo-cygni]|uniref:Ribonuclease P protein subunit n=1 Tax=Ramularia collo-cygni TaxID=112498 RepID=A0A2D3USW9_9PEZI|nr:related to ribonuclease P protein subunit p29 [Ramularia collo-cygni]CZT17968.1 related to ribonuclease P protein subunit p29 [Ramularia collo-cygni]